MVKFKWDVELRSMLSRLSVRQWQKILRMLMLDIVGVFVCLFPRTELSLQTDRQVTNEPGLRHRRFLPMIPVRYLPVLDST